MLHFGSFFISHPFLFAPHLPPRPPKKTAWQQIFGGIYISQQSTLFSLLHVWIVNYQPGIDGLALQPDSFGDVYSNAIIVNVTNGNLYISPQNPAQRPSQVWFGSPTNYNTSYVDKDVWQRVIGSVAYKLLPDSYDCKDYVGSSRLFGLVATDRFGAKSSPLYVTMQITTAGVLWDNSGVDGGLGFAGIVTTNDLTADLIANNQNVGLYLSSTLKLNHTLSGSFGPLQVTN